MSDGRTIAPSPERQNAAARAGLFVRSGLLPAGLVLLFGAAVLAALPFLYQELAALFVHGPFARPSCIAAAYAVFRWLGYALLLVTLPLLLAALQGALMPALIARKGRGSTAVPLPLLPPRGLARLVLRGLGVVLFVALSLYLARVQLGHTARLQAGDLSAAVALWYGLLTWLALAGGVTTAVAVAELAVARAQLWRALHLFAADERREQRQQSGALELKQARRRQGQELLEP